jgi:uncharacterized protein (DUF4415 family)
MSDRSSRRTSVPERQPGVADLARIAALSDAEIAAAVAEDPDAAPLDIDWSRAEVEVPPRKVAVSIRLDADILNYCKDGGDGYQSRINAVLRSYVRACTAGET